MNPFLLSLAQRIFPSIRTLPEDHRQSSAVDVVCSLYAIPLALAGLVWLARVTDFSAIATDGLFFAVLALLLVVFERLRFFLFFEYERGHVARWEESLWSVIIWTAIWMFGAVGLWLYVLWEAGITLVGWRRDRSANHRAYLLRHFTFNLGRAPLAALAALSFCSRLQHIPSISGLSSADIVPALTTILLWWLFYMPIWLPLLVLFNVSPHMASVSKFRITGFFLIAIGWHALVAPFSILAAGLFARYSWGGFLFFISGALLSSVLSNQLSRTADRSRQRSRELANLEELSRELLNTPPDCPNLPEILKSIVPLMFPDRKIEILIFPDTRLLLNPEESQPVADSFWEWLRHHPQVKAFTAKTDLPWQGDKSDEEIVAVPILELEKNTLIGGIYHSRLPRYDRIADSIPALTSLAAQIASTLNRAKAYQQTLTHQRMEQELALAGQIQSSLLPAQLPLVPHWQLSATLQPARETSGDFYDVIPLPDGSLALVVGDVADKGVGPALYMALCRTLIRTFAVLYPEEPERVLELANNRILKDSQAELFVTLFYAVLDPHSGILSYCNAGQNPPYLLSPANPQPLPLIPTGMAMGVMEESRWGKVDLRLAIGDTLVMYTDGVTEAQNEQGEFFGEERLQTTLVAAAQLDSPQAVQTFMNGAAQYDDITMVVLVRRDEKVAADDFQSAAQNRQNLQTGGTIML